MLKKLLKFIRRTPMPKVKQKQKEQKQKIELIGFEEKEKEVAKIDPSLFGIEESVTTNLGSKKVKSYLEEICNSIDDFNKTLIEHARKQFSDAYMTAYDYSMPPGTYLVYDVNNNPIAYGWWDNVKRDYVFVQNSKFYVVSKRMN